MVATVDPVGGRVLDVGDGLVPTFMQDRFVQALSPRFQPIRQSPRVLTKVLSIL